jgi:hypothetical protein
VRSTLYRFVAVLVLVVLVAAPGRAWAGGKPVLSHVQINDFIPDDPATTDDDLCGIPVDTTIAGIANDQVRIGKGGFLQFKGNFSGTVTSTSVETGLSVVNRMSNAYRDISVTDNGDGTATIITATTGVPEQLMTPDGKVLVKDVGRVVFKIIIDFNGTPLDAEDDEFISQEVISESGPHPDLESNFEIFCQVVTDALT